MNNEYLTVTQINKYIKYKFENDSNLNLVYLKGEISNFKNHSSGHLYFTLKDENSRIMAVMFRNNAMKIKFNPTDGTKVLVIGRINVYEANGNYQIYVEISFNKAFVGTIMQILQFLFVLMTLLISCSPELNMCILYV